MGATGEVAFLMGEGLTEEEAWIEVMYSRGKMSQEEYEKAKIDLLQKDNEKDKGDL